MQRRQFLGSVVAGPLVAGCSRRRDSEVIIPTDRSVTVTDRRCGDDRENAATASFADADSVTVSGTVTASHPCATLVTDVFAGIDENAKGEVVVHVEPAVAATPGCEECRAELRYEARFSFDEPPTRVYVKHVTADRGPVQVATAASSG